MPRGDKSSYSSRQKRQAEHIEEGYEKRGVSKKTAEKRAWATVNARTGGGTKKKTAAKKATKKSAAKKKTLAKRTTKSAAKKSANGRTSASRSAAAKKAAQTRARRHQG